MECPNWFDSSLSVHPIYYLSGYKAAVVQARSPRWVGPLLITFCLWNLLNKISPRPNCLLCQRRAAPQTLSSRTEASSVKSPRPLLSSTSRACSLAKITMEPLVHYRPDSTPSPAFPISPDLAPIFHGHGGRNCGNSATGSRCYTRGGRTCGQPPGEGAIPKVWKHW